VVRWEYFVVPRVVIILVGLALALLYVWFIVI
jgi:hypothetical protein